MEEFKNRLLKVYKHIGKWARKQGVTCFRVYDDDLTNFPFAIDLYDQALYVSEYQRKHTLTEDEHAEWLEDCKVVMTEVFDLPIERIYLKKRQRQKGTQQYEKLDQQKNRFMVRENGLRFIINLSDYLDTGLFLDHRNTRQLVKQEAEGKRFLNLFAYTGAFSIYAASGAATTTTTVDLSNTYLNWAQDNFAANGFGNEVGTTHRLIQADVKQYLDSLPQNAFDLVVMDPPTFSNSKRMLDFLDIQRDHVSLINRTFRAMTKGGVIYFSTNYRSFKIDEERIDAASIKNISGQTIPNDFSDKKIHQCFKLVK
jgi:23S rRNA (cytosine1962-C5)-methyltransferase